MTMSRQTYCEYPSDKSFPSYRTACICPWATFLPPEAFPHTTDQWLLCSGRFVARRRSGCRLPGQRRVDASVAVLFDAVKDAMGSSCSFAHISRVLDGSEKRTRGEEPL